MKTSHDPIVLTGDSFYLLDSEFDGDETETALNFLSHGDTPVHAEPWYKDEDETVN